MTIILNGTIAKSMMLGTTPIQRVFLGTLQIWAAEVKAVLANSRDVVISGLFTAAQWSNGDLKKVVVVPANVEIGATTAAYALISSPMADGQAKSWAGELVIEVAGTISGIGGLANSGSGGNALVIAFKGISGQLAKVVLAATAKLRGGGGGGGRAGNGGPGLVSYNYNEGPVGPNGSYFYQRQGGETHVQWGGGSVWDSGGDYSAVSSGGWVYYSQGSGFGAVGRYQTRYNNTAGGVAGNPGRGQGFDGAATAGAASVGGGTNAGASGKSGDGGSWGTSGQAGGNGSNGNNGSGTAGAPAGLAGAYLSGNSNSTITNAGASLQGRLI